MQTLLMHLRTPGGAVALLEVDDLPVMETLKTLIKLCLSVEPKQRPTAAQLLAALVHIKSCLSSVHAEGISSVQPAAETGSMDTPAQPPCGTTEPSTEVPSGGRTATDVATLDAAGARPAGTSSAANSGTRAAPSVGEEPTARTDVSTTTGAAGAAVVPEVAGKQSGSCAHSDQQPEDLGIAVATAAVAGGGVTEVPPRDTHSGGTSGLSPRPQTPQSCSSHVDVSDERDVVGGSAADLLRQSIANGL
jgi:hypothetical protein